ncbi:phosphotransferase family protein [Mycolicibacter longobardus]|uniref:phosphotransferase family protein n=1 Tax=Mycolicibacter longobardus TaxID=1108812 RepID=UPI0021F37940|nr:phosphotransferase family protein [Mycolicibacter longobardus]MCV7382248.1 phosphotransferase family protein [Mycolicibacter longobardus]
MQIADEDVRMAAVAKWLADRRGGPVELAVQGKPGSGFSADNLILTASADGHTTTYVLRVDSSDEQPYPEQAPGLGTGVAWQARVMAALVDRVPVAPLVGVELDPSVLGVPFLVMDFVEGVVPKEMPPCTAEGFYADAAPGFRETMIRSGLAALAGVHTVPWRERGLTDLDAGPRPPGAARQFELWDTHLRNGLRGRDADVFRLAGGWLRSNLPPAPADDDVVLVWGDARLGNVIWDAESGTPKCLTDFEGVAIGERELDLGWWLMADRWMHEGSGVARLAGEPTRAEQVSCYEAAAGRRVADLHWYELFAAYRFATTVVVVMNNWEKNGMVPGDHLIWRDNPATELIRIIMDSRGSA